jgi:hypothetical protein
MPQPKSIFLPTYFNFMPHEQDVAILIDGDFFLKRYRTILDKNYYHTPQQVVRNYASSLCDMLAAKIIYIEFFITIACHLKKRYIIQLAKKY